MSLITKDRFWEPAILMKIHDLTRLGHDVYENTWFIESRARSQKSGRPPARGRIEYDVAPKFMRLQNQRVGWESQGRVMSFEAGVDHSSPLVV